MKKLFIQIAAIVISINLFAQAPQKMSYQAVIRNASNNLVVNVPVKMRISILQGSATGTSVYSELHSAATNANGLVSIEIGTGTSQQGTFSAINWGNGTYYLKTETDPTNGTNYTITGTSQLLSVPYAFFSRYSGSLQYPDGISDDVIYITPGSKFRVPNGKNFFITHVQNGITIDNYTFDAPYPTIKIIGPNKEIGTIDERGYINGFLINIGVTAIDLDLNEGNYIVPQNKTFVFYGTDEEFFGPTTTLKINDISPNPNNNSDFPESPLILRAGTIISCQCRINGYLRDAILN